MAAVAPVADQTVDLLKNLSLDTQPKALEIPEPTKKPSVDTTGAVNGVNQPLDRSVTPLIPDFMDPTVAYFPNGYYYGGYDGTANDWDNYSRYVNPDGVDMAHGVYGDMYHGYGYAPYGPYSPAGSPLPTVGHDGQLYGAQPFQYPNPYFPPMTPTSGPYTSAVIPPKGVNAPSATADQTPLTVDSTNGVKGTTGSAPVKPAAYQNSIFNGSYKKGAQNGFQDPRYGFDGSTLQSLGWMPRCYPMDKQETIPILPLLPMGMALLQEIKTTIHISCGYMNQMYPNKLYSQYGSNYRSGYGYGANGYDYQSNGRGWLATDNKYKPRGRVNGFYFYNNENGDGLNELNRGPRTRSVKNQKVLTPITLAVKGQNLTTPSEGVKKEPEVIEKDDVHKSVKYNVWASTQNGNKKLDAAYQEAQQKPGSCPVFLFFSVNTSGQFVGVAEMVGPVDFNKSLEYWQQDKWIGCFPVKWHIVKDLPNSLLKHITLENNENKPVTNSRDTQEVKLEQGLQVLKIFKEESSKQCILDDFDFYEDRQRRIQEKKAKQQQFQKQMWEGKPKEGIKVENLAPKSSETPQETVKEAGSVHINGDVKPAAEKDIMANGVANA
ncbi:putative YTH domain-containing protein [Helianthus annuus]|nr:putative YTH domain-containing protein [Helianthus annuus]